MAASLFDRAMPAGKLFSLVAGRNAVEMVRVFLHQSRMPVLHAETTVEEWLGQPVPGKAIFQSSRNYASASRIELDI
jgi:hypothetical protein